jgi:L-threonylcarbamoyladenylate synthase
MEIDMTMLLEYSPHGFKKLAECVESGKVIGLSNGLQFGLCANALDEDAIEKLHNVKRRRQPLSVCMPKDDADKYAYVPNAARLLIERYWPGYLTLILNKKRAIPDYATVEAGNTVCLGYLVDDIDELYSKGYLSVPMAMSSANRHGEKQTLSWQECHRAFEGEVEAILMAPECPAHMDGPSRNSTQVSFASDPPEVRRPGFVRFEELQELIPELVLTEA